MLIYKMRKLLLFLAVLSSQCLFAQKNDVDLLKSEMGNEVTYYAKNNVRDAMTVEINIEGTGFTCNVPLPAKVDLRSYEKKFLIKLTLDPSGNSNYSVSYKTYKKAAAPAGPVITGTGSKVTMGPQDRPELKKGIVVFSKDGCGKCQYAINYLNEKKIPYKELNISKDEADQKYMWQVLMESGFNATSVQTPVIMVNGKAHYNMDIKAFLAELKP